MQKLAWDNAPRKQKGSTHIAIRTLCAVDISILLFYTVCMTLTACAPVLERWTHLLHLLYTEAKFFFVSSPPNALSHWRTKCCNCKDCEANLSCSFFFFNKTVWHKFAGYVHSLSGRWRNSHVVSSSPHLSHKFSATHFLSCLLTSDAFCKYLSAPSPPPCLLLCLAELWTL